LYGRNGPKRSRTANHGKGWGHEPVKCGHSNLWRPKNYQVCPSPVFLSSTEVDSAILQISVYDKPAVDVEISSFFTLVRAGFSAARKQIVNPLAHGLDMPKQYILQMLARAGIDPQRRAETLSIEEWGRLWQEYTRPGNPQ